MEKEITDVKITQEDIKFLSGEAAEADIKTENKVLMERLRNAKMDNSSLTQEDVCNLLANDMIEKEKIKD